MVVRGNNGEGDGKRGAKIIVVEFLPLRTTSLPFDSIGMPKRRSLNDGSFHGQKKPNQVESLILEATRTGCYKARVRQSDA